MTSRALCVRYSKGVTAIKRIWPTPTAVQTAASLLYPRASA